MSHSFSPENTRIAVIGCGNVGTQFACICAAKHYRVRVFSSKPELFHPVLEVEDEYGSVVSGRIEFAGKNIGQVVSDCNLIFVAYPAFLFMEAAKMLLPFIRPGMGICVLPGTGGAEFAFQACLAKGAVLYGIQRVPTVARLSQFGKKVRCEGLRKAIHVASIPNDYASDFAAFMKELWGIPCHTLPNYLNVTLTPSNPILHTTRLKTLFADYRPGMVYQSNPLFYGEWDLSSARLLLACDEELQAMCRIMTGLDLSGVLSLRLHYESNTAQEITEKLRSIKSLHNLLSPMKQVPGGWIPDFQSRYFSADFPYGLAIIEELAEILGCNAQNIRDTMKWYRDTTGDFRVLSLKEYGISRAEDIFNFYT